MQGIPDPRTARPPRRLRKDVPPVRLPDRGEEVDIRHLMVAMQAAMNDRLEEGLRAIHRSASKLMKQVAAEVWRSSGPDAADNLQQGVVGTLARDDAIRGLISHVDERYQALNLDIGRMEEALRKLAAAAGEALRRSEGATELVEQVARATQEQGRRSHMGLAELAARLERSLEPVTTRLESVVAAVDASNKRQRADLTQFAQRTAEGLARVGQRLSEGFAAMNERVETQHEQMLRDMEGAVRAEVDRIEEIGRDRTTQALAETDRLAQSVRDTAEGAAAEMESLRRVLDARLDRLSTQMKTAIEEAAERLARRQQDELRAAVIAIGTGTRDARREPAREPAPADDRIEEPPAHTTQADLEQDLANLAGSIEELGSQ